MVTVPHLYLDLKQGRRCVHARSRRLQYNGKRIRCRSSHALPYGALIFNEISLKSRNTDRPSTSDKILQALQDKSVRKALVEIADQDRSVESRVKHAVDDAITDKKVRKAILPPWLTHLRRAR